MRNVINKGLTEEMILDGAAQAFAGGWNKVKLYFMLGLPGETEEDMKEISRLADRVARKYYEIPKIREMGNARLHSAPPSLSQNHLPRFSGPRCSPRKTISTVPT